MKLPPEIEAKIERSAKIKGCVGKDYYHYRSEIIKIASGLVAEIKRQREKEYENSGVISARIV